MPRLHTRPPSLRDRWSWPTALRNRRTSAERHEGPVRIIPTGPSMCVPSKNRSVLGNREPIAAFDHGLHEVGTGQGFAEASHRDFDRVTVALRARKHPRDVRA